MKMKETLRLGVNQYRPPGKKKDLEELVRRYDSFEVDGRMDLFQDLGQCHQNLKYFDARLHGIQGCDFKFASEALILYHYESKRRWLTGSIF